MPLDNDDNKGGLSVRDSIIGALEHHAEQGNDDARETVDKLEQRSKDLDELNGRSLVASKSRASDDAEVEDTGDEADDIERGNSSNSDSSIEEKRGAVEEQETTEAGEQEPKDKSKSAFAHNKEAQGIWSKLPKEMQTEAVRSSLAGIAKDIQDNKAAIGRLKAERARNPDNAQIDTLVDRYFGSADNAPGVVDFETGEIKPSTKAAHLKNLMHTFDTLYGASSPMEARLYTLAKIALYNGIDISRSTLAPYIEHVVADAKEQQQHASAYIQHRQQMQEAEKTVAPKFQNWTASKPHIAQVGPTMVHILEGVYKSDANRGNKDISQKDFDMAYIAACQSLGLNPNAGAQQPKAKPRKQGGSDLSKNQSVRAHLKAAIAAQARE